MKLCKRVGILCFPQRQLTMTRMGTTTISLHRITYLHGLPLGNPEKIALSFRPLSWLKYTKNGNIVTSK